MLSFDIRFISSTQFEFVDSSDYTGLTVTQTELRVYTDVPITNENFNTTNLFPNPLVNLGDNYTVDLEIDLDDFTTLFDNVYRFDYVVTSDENGEESVTLYTIKDLDLKECRRKIVQDVISNKDSCLACELASFDSILNSAYSELEEELYKESEILIEYLKDICRICNC